MSTIDLSGICKQLKDIEEKFNASQSPTERYALLQCINHIAEHQLKFHPDNWFIEQYRQGSLREHGIDPDIKRG